MPNTYSSSLEQIFQDLDDKKSLAGNLTDPLFEAFDAERAAKAAAGARWAQQYDPDTYAKAAKLAPGVPVDSAARQIKTVEERARLDQLLSVLEKSPPVRDYFAADPKKLAFANPDELDQISGINWAIRAFPAAVSAGYDQTRLGLARYDEIAGTDTPESRKLAAELAAKPQRTFGVHGEWFPGGLVGLGQSLPTMASVLVAGAEGGVKGAVAGGATGLTVGLLAGGGGALPGAATGFTLGGSTGAAYGSTMQNIKIQAGLAYNEFLQIKDENGQPLDPLLAKWAAMLAGIGGGALEQLGLSKTIGQIPGVDRLLGAMTKDGMKKVLLDQGMRGALLRFAKGLGTAVTVETLTEVGQEGFIILAQELAKSASSEDFKMMTSEEVGQRLTEAGVQALQVMTLLGPVASGTRFAADLATMRRSKQANDRLREVGEQLDGNGFIERSPQVAQEVIDKIAPDQKVYIPAKEMKELYQSQNLDVYGPELPNWRQRFDDALAIEGDVEISLGEFYAHLAKNPKDNPIYDLARTDPRDYLRGEMLEYDSAMNELLQTEMARADTTVSPQLDTRIRDIVSEQIKALGFTPQAANHLATVFDAYNAVKARQLGLDPQVMAEQIMPEFVRTMEGNRGLVENGNEASPSLPGELYQPAWHGSPHVFDQFSLDHIGRGEGAQAFGWGLYFAGERGIAEGYRNRLTRQQSQLTYKDAEGNVKQAPQTRMADAVMLAHDEPANFPKNARAAVWTAITNFANGADLTDALVDMKNDLEQLYGEAAPEIKIVEDYVQNMGLERKTPGRLFQVELPDDEQLLIWDEALDDQTELVRNVFIEAGVSLPRLETAIKLSEKQSTVREVLAGDSLEGYLLSLVLSKSDPDFIDQEARVPDSDLDRVAYLYEIPSSDGVGDPEIVWSLDEPADAETITAWATSELTGQNAYEQLSNMLGGDRKASEYLRSKGIAGHKYLDGFSRRRGEGSYNYVIYDDTQIKVIEYLQENRGSITFREDGPPLIKAFEQADMSTLLHEAGHWFLQTTRDLAEKSPEIAADWAVIKRHLGIGDDNLITREQHERFARMGEAYFMEGKAPSAELRSAFAAFRQWLKAIYRSITKLGGSVHPEIAKVFDNMLRVDQALDATLKDSPYAQVFKSAEEMGVSLEDYAEYQRLVEDLKASAQDGVIGRIIGQQKRLQTGWMKKIAGELRKEAEEKLSKQPPYQHMAAFIEGGFRLSSEEFSKRYGKEAAKKFPRQAFNKTGLDLDVAAELLGYPTADEMVYDFTQALPLKEAAKQMAEQEMVRRYGTDTDQQAVLDLAVKRAMAEEGRLVVLAKEFKALQQKAGRTVSENGPRQMAQEIARRTIYTRKFKDVREAVTHATLRRLAAQADAAIAKGDWTKAADYKRKQLLAQALDNETQLVNRTVEKIRQKAVKYTKTASKSVDPSTMEQIRALVTQYEFAKISGRQLARRESLREYVAKANAEGLSISVPDELLRRTARISYKELSVEDLLGFGDVLDNLEHIGRLKNKLRTAKGLREWALVKKEITDSLAKRKRKPKKMDTYSNPKKSYFDGLMAFHATLLKPEQIVEWLDSGEIGGPLMEYVFQPIADAQTAQNELNLEYNTRLMKIFEKLSPGYLAERVQISSLNTTMTREEVFTVALNTGNDSNRRKLTEGHQWSEAQLSEILSHMKDTDWAAAQKVWDLLDSLWPKVSALEKKLTGVAPPKIEGREFTNQYGTFRGGYYPVVYDFDTPVGMNLTEDTTPADAQTSLESILFPNKFIKPGTNHVHTYKRQKVSKPIRLNLNVLPGHIHNVVHDLTYREAVRSAYKVLWDPDIKQAISDIEGRDTYEQLTFWLQKVASEQALESDPGARLANRLRTGATIYGMGYRVSTALAQPLGFFPALTRVGVTEMAGAIYQMARHPLQTRQMVMDMSGELRHRFNQQERDIRDTVQSLSINPTRVDKFRAWAFWHIGMVDQWVSTTVWLAAYGKQLEKDPKNTDLAIRQGDRVVRLTQGTGNVKDMAKIVNNGAWQKLFTMFYSFFSAQYNMQVDLTRKTIRDIREGNVADLFTERLPQWSYLVVLPAIFGALLTGQGPDEDENKLLWALRKTLLYPVAAVPFARDAVSVFEGFRYRFTPAAKAFEEATRGLAKVAKGDLTGAVEPALVSTSVWLKLPTGQFLNTSKALWEGLGNDDLEATDLVYGRRDK